MEAAAQNRVCVQSRLPRLRQTRRVQPGGFHAELVDIRARQRLVHTVEQQPALHRRQRIQILDLPRRHRHVIKLRLGQVGQREIGRGHTAVARVDAMRHHGLQVRFDGRCQRLNIGLVEACLTEAQVQFQLPAKHLAVHRQPVGQG